MKNVQSYTRLQVVYFATILIAVLIVCFLIFQPFFTVLVISGTIAVILSPVYERIVTFLKGRRVIGAFITIILLLTLIIVPLFFLGKMVFTQAHETYTALVQGRDVATLATTNIETKIAERFPDANINFRVYITQFTEWLLGNVNNVFSGTLDLVIKTLLGGIALFYFLKDGTQFKNVLVSLSPLPDEYDNRILDRLHGAIKSIIQGSFMIAIIQGLLSGAGFFIFGVPNPALWGIIAAICALVPGFGTSLVLVPAIIYLFFAGTGAAAIGLALWGALLVGLVDNFLSPILMQRGINIHPLFILFSIIGGLAFFGPSGFIMGPLFLSLLFTLFDIYHLFIQREKVEEASE